MFLYFCVIFSKFFKLLIYSLQTKCPAIPEVTETATEEAAVEKPPKKKKKKKKDPEPCEAEDGTTELTDFVDVTIKEETDSQINNSVNGLLEKEPKKKKKKKKKHQEDQDQDPVFQGSDSSGYQSDHKKKKKKRKEAEFTPLSEHAPKKKREK